MSTSNIANSISTSIMDSIYTYPILPYINTENVTLALINLNDINTVYNLNKSFVRLLSNDKFLSNFNLINAQAFINPYLKDIIYNNNTRVLYNTYNKYSTNPLDKFSILACLKDDNLIEPSPNNTLDYGEDASSTNKTWAIDTYYIDITDFTGTDTSSYIKQLPLKDRYITPLSSYIKAGTITSEEDLVESPDYVIKTGIIHVPFVIYASSTDWGSNQKLDPNRNITNKCYSWYRIYKSGYVECGGMSRPFSLTEQWNGSYAKDLIKIAFPININCINLNYNLMGCENNFITAYDSKYNKKVLALYPITEGRQSAKNYIYGSMPETPDANIGNYIQEITNSDFTIQINHETYDLSNDGLGKTDAAVTKITWTASGILV